MPHDLAGLIKKKKTVAVPGAFDAASALLIEAAGFEALYISGAGLSNSSGLPDTGILSRDEAVMLSSYITRAVKIPVIADVDTGFGGPKEVKKTVKAFEAIGVSAVQMEDQAFPKRCGHLPGKEVIDAGEFIKKIKASVSARASKKFLVIARTDARTVAGMDSAVERARMYVDAGADMVFPEALLSRDEFRYFSKSVKAPLIANMTEFGRTPYITVDEFNAMGYSIVLFPVTVFRAALKAVESSLAVLREKGTQKGLLKKMKTRDEIYRLLKYTPE